MKNISSYELKVRQNERTKCESGYSLIELLVVLTILTIMSSIAIFYLAAHTRPLKTEDQALRAIDIFQDAKQRALTQRRSMRLEVNLTKQAIRLIDENTVGNLADDVEIKRVNLFTGDVKVNPRPVNVASNPPEPLAGSAMTFTTSNHPLSTGDSVAVFRFTLNGQVSKMTGVNGLGAEQFAPGGGTFFVWQPNKAVPANSDLTRAITIVGTTGSMKLWDYDPSTNIWKSRR